MLTESLTVIGTFTVGGHFVYWYFCLQFKFADWLLESLVVKSKAFVEYLNVIGYYSEEQY